MQARIVSTTVLLFIYLRETYKLAFLCRIPFKFILLQPPPFFLQSRVIPVFIRTIATLPTTIIQNGMPNVVLERHITPIPHQLHASSCTQPYMSRFYFLNRVSLVPKYRARGITYILSRFLYPIRSFGVVY